MAASGSFNTSAYDGRYLTFAWEETSQSVETNKTTIKWTLTGAGGNNSWYKSGNFKVVIAGQTVYSSATRIQLHKGTVVASGTFVFTHNADGTKSFTASAEAGIYTYAVNCKGSTTFSLDMIPRKSTLYAPVVGTLGTRVDLSIESKSASFQHTIVAKCGSWQKEFLTKGWSTTLGWTPSLVLAEQNTQGVNLTVEFTLTTYSGNTNIGSTTTKMQLLIPSSVTPSCYLALEDVTGVDKIYGSPVQGLSRIKATVTPTLAYGSPIKSQSIVADGDTYKNLTVTFGPLKAAGVSPVNAKVTDARGYSGTASYTMNVQAYTPPSIPALIVRRCNVDGSANDQGEYIRVIFDASISSMNDKNTAAYKLRYKKATATSWTEITLQEFAGIYGVLGGGYTFAADSNSAYDVEVQAIDRHHTTTRSTSASTAFSILNWGANGTSIGVGKVAERSNSLEVAFDTYLEGSTIQLGNRYSFSSPGVANSGGFVRMVRITLTAKNADAPMTFVFSQRQQPTTMTVHVTLNNSTMDASSVSSVVYEGSNYGAYVSKVDELTYELFVLKGSNSDTITLQDWYTSKTMEDCVSITFLGDLVSQLPVPYYKAIYAQMESLLNYIYPVDSVYISYSHKNPAEIFGGTWVRITNAFLWAVDDSGSIGQTGGEKTHMLTVNELPSHSHGSVYSGNASGTKNHSWLASGGTNMAYGAVATGGGQAHNNMPPYIQVSVWRRTE